MSTLGCKKKDFFKSNLKPDSKKEKSISQTLYVLTATNMLETHRNLGEKNEKEGSLLHNSFYAARST